MDEQGSHFVPFPICPLWLFLNRLLWCCGRTCMPPPVYHSVLIYSLYPARKGEPSNHIHIQYHQDNASLTLGLLFSSPLLHIHHCFYLFKKKYILPLQPSGWKPSPLQTSLFASCTPLSPVERGVVLMNINRIIALLSVYWIRPTDGPPRSF